MGHVPSACITQPAACAAVACGCYGHSRWSAVSFRYCCYSWGLNSVCCPCVVVASYTLLCATFSRQMPCTCVDMQLDGDHVGSSKDKVLYVVVSYVQSTPLSRWKNLSREYGGPSWSLLWTAKMVMGPSLQSSMVALGRKSCQGTLGLR